MLVGFCILNDNKSLDHRRFFPSGVSIVSKRIGHATVYLFGYGSEFDHPIEEQTYSLYPEGLNHRNIHVRISSDLVEIKSDWLGSFPCYYDEIQKEVASHWGMLDLDLHDNDPIGSYTLKKYSFIPTSRTLKCGVKRMLSDQTLVWSPTAIKCISRQSSFDLNTATQNADVVQSVASRLRKDGLDASEVIIPLSGGYDSRFLATIVKGEFGRNFRSYTYSLLGPRGDCFESKVSKVVAQKLGSPWRSLDLTGYAQYEKTIADWTGGFSHVNGDYYEMFAEQLLQGQEAPSGNKSLLISGIVGDAWCGKILIPYHRGIQAKRVLLNHGICTYEWLFNKEEERAASQAENELNEFFNERVHSNETILLELVRAKIALLSFLCYSFERRGVRCSAPFLDKTVVQKVLSLDQKQRLNRHWQDEYFKEIGLADDQLPKILFKLNRLAIDEGAKKRFESFQRLNLPEHKQMLLKFLLSNPVRRLEATLTRHKVTEYLLRKLGYKRSDVLISILNVIAK